MNSLFASIFSPRKATDERVVSQSPSGPKSALSSKKARRTSLPDTKLKRTVRFTENLDEEPQPTTPTKARQPIQRVKTPGAHAASPKSPDGGSKAPKSPDRNDEGEEEEEFAFRQFLGHQWVGDSIEIEVEWADGDRTWQDESGLHNDAPDALFEYWESQGGRPTNPEDPDMYHIFAIKKHSKDRKRLLVEWVGYGPKDATWAPRSQIEETAPEIVAEYWKTVKTTHPGRPRRGRR